MITAQSFIPLNERLREALRPGGNLRPSSETVFDGPGFVRREHWCPVQMGHEGAGEIWQNGRSLVAGQGAAEFEHLLRCAHYLKHHHEHHAAHPLRFGGFGLPSPLQCTGKGTQSCQDIKQNGFVVRGKLVHFLNLDAVGVELCGQAFTRMTPGLRFLGLKPRACNSYRQALRQFFLWLQSENIRMPSRFIELDARLSSAFGWMILISLIVTQAMLLVHYQGFIPKSRCKLPLSRQYFSN